MMNIITSYAQNREDILLAAFLSDIKNGLYVDVGAADPDKDSVTKYFYELGWRGINIEPNKELHKELVAKRSRDINLNIGAADEDNERTIRIYKGSGYGLSTISKGVMEQHESEQTPYTHNYQDQKIKVRKLSSIFDEYEVKDIDFLKIDVEGAEKEVLQGNDWGRFRPKVICIEENHMQADWKKLLKKAHYHLAYNDGLNEYYLAEEEKQRKETFSSEYLRLAVGSHVVRPEVKSLIDNNNSDVRKLQLKIAEYRSIIAIRTDEVLELREKLNQAPGVLRSIKLLAKSIDKDATRLENYLRNRTHRTKFERDSNFTPTGKGVLGDIRAYDYRILEPKRELNLGWYILDKIYSFTVNLFRLLAQKAFHFAKLAKDKL